MARRKGYTDTYEMRKRRRQTKDKITRYVGIVLGALLLAFVVIRLMTFSLTIQGDSMEPTYVQGDKHLINRVIYHLKSPSRYDIIVFKLDKNDSQQYFVKRVVGVPGDTVEIKNGKIYVNQHKAKTFSKESIISGGVASERIRLKQDEFFVLGDNYNNSEDSRSAGIGNVKRKNIIGKVGLKYWPVR